MCRPKFKICLLNDTTVTAILEVGGHPGLGPAHEALLLTSILPLPILLLSCYILT